MKSKTTITAILAISLFGLLFSGYLSYNELFAPRLLGAVTYCTALGAPGTVFGYPACVYGFFMYLLIVIISVAGLRHGKRHN